MTNGYLTVGSRVFVFRGTHMLGKGVVVSVGGTQSGADGLPQWSMVRLLEGAILSNIRHFSIVRNIGAKAEFRYGFHTGQYLGQECPETDHAAYFTDTRVFEEEALLSGALPDRFASLNPFSGSTEGVRNNPNNCTTCDYSKVAHRERERAHCYMFLQSPTEVCRHHTSIPKHSLTTGAVEAVLRDIKITR